jgi:hypothetical protein
MLCEADDEDPIFIEVELLHPIMPNLIAQASYPRMFKRAVAWFPVWLV